MAAAENVTKKKVVAAIPKLEELAKKMIADGGVPGLAIAVVYKDEVIYLHGFGRIKQVLLSLGGQRFVEGLQKSAFGPELSSVDWRRR